MRAAKADLRSTPPAEGVRSTFGKETTVKFWDLQKGFINKGFIKRVSEGISFDVELVLETIGIHS